MNKKEATAILAEHLKEYRKRSYAELQFLLNEQEVCEVAGPSGTVYQLEFQAVWDSKKGEDLRVMGSIDDGGWRAFVPLGHDFIMRPDGTFVGE